MPYQRQHLDQQAARNVTKRKREGQRTRGLRRMPSTRCRLSAEPRERLSPAARGDTATSLPPAPRGDSSLLPLLRGDTSWPLIAERGDSCRLLLLPKATRDEDVCGERASGGDLSASPGASPSSTANRTPCGQLRNQW